MALQRRSSNRFQSSIWPGFVDAMTGLLLVLMFVLTIFTVVQFVLRDTISGQESELDQLSTQVQSLADALGLEQRRSGGLGSQVASLTETLNAADIAAREQAGQIAVLTRERDVAAAALTDAESQITAFEAQVAGLLVQSAELETEIASAEDQIQSLQSVGENARATITELEAAQAVQITQADALNLALAQARAEIDAEAEAARLAAARTDALNAMIADLQRDVEADVTRIAGLSDELAQSAQALAAARTQATRAGETLSEQEAARLAEAAAAAALRERLAEADTELTAMTLVLEEQRRAAENTLTLLAAAEVARGSIDGLLTEALLAQQALQAELDQATEGSTQTASAEDRLRQALLANQTLEAEITALSQTQTDADVALGAVISEQEEQALLLATARARLTEEEGISLERAREVALLNEQIAALRTQIGTLQTLLDLADETDVQSQVQLETLSSQLNTALARAVSEARRRELLEVAERERLEAEAVRLVAEAQDLEQYRSEFFGRLREVVADMPGVQIDGDRFVFSSEVLFDSGRATLSEQGQGEISAVAGLLRQIAEDIPSGIDWVIRVDGHTDNVPLSGQGQFRSNWELSQARALSVVLYMIDHEGIPPGRLAANGFGEFQPVNPDDTPQARAQNRRIELKLTER